MLFLSKLVGRPVRDRHGESFGKVRDLIVALGEQYPPVTGLVVRVTGGRDIFLPWTDVEEIDADGARLRTTLIDMASFRQRPNEIRLWLDLLDKQIVDVEGRKIVRVNDIQLAPVEERLRLVAVDVGLAGILRRLGLSGPGERLARALHLEAENYIEWEDVDPVESSVSSLKLRVPHEALGTLHPADVAHIVEQLAPRDRAGILAALDDERAADVLEELAADDQVDILEALSPEKAADILEEMGPDEAADLVADLSEERQERAAEPHGAGGGVGRARAARLRRGDRRRPDDDRFHHRHAGDDRRAGHRAAARAASGRRPGLLPVRHRCRRDAGRHHHPARADRRRAGDVACATSCDPTRSAWASTWMRSRWGPRSRATTCWRSRSSTRTAGCRGS